jgi:hypothetical protein
MQGYGSRLFGNSVHAMHRQLCSRNTEAARFINRRHSCVRGAASASKLHPNDIRPSVLTTVEVSEHLNGGKKKKKKMTKKKKRYAGGSGERSIPGLSGVAATGAVNRCSKSVRPIASHPIRRLELDAESISRSADQRPLRDAKRKRGM